MQGEWAGGKGSKERISDYASYNNNYDKIFGKKMGRETLEKAVDGDFVLLTGDVIEWIKFDSKTVEIKIVGSEPIDNISQERTHREVLKSVGLSFRSEPSDKVFQISADDFEEKYKPAFK